MAIEIPERGKVCGLSSDEYHAHEALGSSDLVQILRSPAHYLLNKDRPSTAAMVLGTAVHAAVLEPTWRDTHQRAPESHGYGSVASQTFRDLEAECQARGKALVLAKDYDRVMRIAGPVKAHPQVARLLECGEPEVSWFATDTGPGKGGLEPIPVRARSDWWIEAGRTGPTLVDLKTFDPSRKESRIPDPLDPYEEPGRNGWLSRAFHRTVFDYGYHMQLSWYRHVIHLASGVRPTRTVIIVADKPKIEGLAARGEDPVAGVGVFELDEETVLRQGADLWMHALLRWRQYLANERPLGYPPTVVKLGG